MNRAIDRSANALALCAFFSFNLSSQPAYLVTDLGSLGGQTAVARGINNAGNVVGEADTSGGIRHAFIWVNGSMQDLNLSLQPSVAFAINTLNQVVGAEGPTPFQNPSSLGPANGFSWTSGGSIQTLQSLPSAAYTAGLAINAAGQIAGTSTTPNPYGRAILWLSATSAPQDIGGSGPSSLAYGINSTGQVVGWTNNWGGTIAFSWTSIGGLQDLGTLPGDSASRAAGINDVGQVVGASWPDGTNNLHAFLWTSSSEMQGLGTLGGTVSMADAINASGQVVGSAQTTSGASHAFLWQNGAMADLNALISDPSWVLTEATAINDNGQIVGYGMHNGQTRGFLLQTEPQTGTIQVTTNLPSASFTILGPATYSGSGTSFIQLNAPAGTYTVAFGTLTGYITPPPQTETLSAGGTVGFTGTYVASRVTLGSITGWTLGNLVENAQWTGQPAKDRVPGTNGYNFFYAIDACQHSSPCLGSGSAGLEQIAVNPVWHLHGSGFCPPIGCSGQKGSLSFSDVAINATTISDVKKWTNTEISFTPSFVFPSYQYTVNPSVSITITTPDGQVTTLPLPTAGGEPATPGTIAAIDGRGYGQCTWYVANQRIAQGLPIPVPAYYTVGAIDENYVPQQWDVIDFTKEHTAIIISPVNSNLVNSPNGSQTTTYTFTIGEMNVGKCPQQGEPCQVSAWSQEPSTVNSEFVITVSNTGVRSVQTRIYSLDTASTCKGLRAPYCPATDYFR